MYFETVKKLTKYKTKKTWTLEAAEFRGSGCSSHFCFLQELEKGVKKAKKRKKKSRKNGGKKEREGGGIGNVIYLPNFAHFYYLGVGIIFTPSLLLISEYAPIQ